MSLLHFSQKVTQMSQRFDDSAKEEVRSRADIVSIVGRYVNLKQAGQTFKGLCPFHKEKTPSFNVNPVHGFYHCFGCGKGGDVFSFIQEIENVEFREALKILAQETGVTLKSESREKPDSSSVAGSAPSKTELLEIHELAARFFYDSMRSSPQAVDYFKSRGLDAQTVKDFGLGFAPDGWSGLCDYLQQNNVPISCAVECGLAVKKENGGAYDRFRNRIIFPLFDITGKVIAFAGRGMSPDVQPKYLNSPETTLYRKNSLLYGIHKARQSIRETGYVLIVEGYMDYLSLYQAGICNVVATSGTAFTTQHAYLLNRFSKKAVLVFDGDSAGVNAAEKAVMVLASGSLDVSILNLPAQEDPDSYVRKNGADPFLNLVKNSQQAFSFIINKATSENDISSAFGKKQVVERLTPYMRLLTDPLIKEEFARELSEKLRIDTRHLKKILSPNSSETLNRPVGESRGSEAFSNSLEGNFLRILLTSPDLINQAKQYVAPQTLTNKLSENIYSIILDKYSRTGDLKGLTDQVTDPELRRMISTLIVKPALADHIHDDMVQKIVFLRKKYLRSKIGETKELLRNNPQGKAQYLEQLKDLSMQLKELD